MRMSCGVRAALCAALFAVGAQAQTPERIDFGRDVLPHFRG